MPYRKVSRCQEDFAEIIYKVSDILKLRDIEYCIEFGCEDIDSFLHGTFKVQLTGIKDGSKVQQHTVIKWHPEERIRKKFRHFYHREFAFYQYVVPALLEIQRRFGIIEGLKIKFPNCVFANDQLNKETIVVFSLQEGQFQMLDRFYKVDFAHATLVVKHLAKLHALSFALENRDPDKFNEIKRLYYKEVQYFNMESVPESMESYFLTSVSVVQDPIAREKLEQLGRYLVRVLHTCVMPGPHSVICHADSWNNNILFKYQNGKPVDVVFIDYQLSRLASPVTDLSYYFYMSTEKEFLTEHYDQVLNIYYGTLAGVLRYCDLDVAEIYPREVFEKQLKDYSVLGLVEALVSMKIITADIEEALEMTERMVNDSEKENYDNVHPNQVLFRERVNGIVDHFFSGGYSLDAVLKK